MRKFKKDSVEATVLTGVLIALLTILAFGWLNSCTPQRRLNRLIKKHPELLYKDTLIVKDTVSIVIPSIKLDTFVKVEQLKDTIFFQKDFVKVKVFERNDTVFISAQTDTIYKNVYRTMKIPVERVIYRKPRDGLTIFDLIGFVLAVILGFALNKFSRDKT